MARKYLVSVDLSKNELQNAVVQVLASAPASPVEGLIYYNSVDKVAYIYNGTAWKKMEENVAVSFGTPGSSAVGDSAAAGSATTVARSDHAHGREAFGTSASTQAIGDAAAAGSAATPSRSDHKHGLPSFGGATAQTSFGASSGNGSATTPARSDHAHGTPTHDAAAHNAIKISDLAAPTASVAFNAQKITGLADPTSAQDAATKAYVDATAVGLDFKQSVRAATTANITLSGTQAIDGVSVVAGDRVLVKNQNTGADNGIYVVAAGSWSRATDADTSAEVTAGAFMFVEEGTTLADTSWVLSTNAPITLGTTALTFTQFGASTSYTAGSGLTLSGTTFNVGAGTGITVNADDVAIDTTVVARKYATSIGDGTNTSYTVTHSLSTRDVIVQVYDNASPYAQVECDVEHATTSAVTIKFTSAPSSNAYRVLVQG